MPTLNLKSLYNSFKENREGSWIMDFKNCVALYKFIQEHDIKRVLDLGTGIGASAAFCALALNEKGVDYTIDSVEQFDKCVDLAKKFIPEELKKNLTIHKANAVVWTMPYAPTVNFSTYETLPEGDYDLIINDGPSFWRDGNYLVDLPNGTITKMLLEGKIKPNTFVVWDGRISMLQLLERYFSSNFEIYRAARPNQDDMNILRRLDNPPFFQDEKLKAINEQTTFFNEVMPTDNSETSKSEDETLDQGASEAL